ncbi:MAG: transporter substrate-binding domain-containing protein, partial [Thermoanaerobaculia bacterium]|nr:transporter substrate-binding domain-containing protein [Thermoanaerobaculia bacterium]
MTRKWMLTARKWMLTALAILILVACGQFPRDPRKSLEEASGNILVVGVSESYPWVVKTGGEPAGVEPELVRRFADSIEADIEWKWGAPRDHYAALEQYDLHLAITGLTKASPWSKHLGVSQPYHESHIVVARPPDQEPAEEIDGLKVLVPESGAYAGWVREHDGVPVPAGQLSRADALVAIDDWRVEELGLMPTGIILHKHQHVIAAPPGENALLMALENSFEG